MAVELAVRPLEEEQQEEELVEELTARQTVRAWVKEKIEEDSEIKAPEFADEAVKHFGGNSALLLELGREMLREMVYRLVLECLAATRSGSEEPPTKGAQPVVAIAPGVPAIATRPLPSVERRWTEWKEWAIKRHVKLMDMTHEDLKSAIEARSKRVKTEIVIVNLWKRLLKKVPPDGQTKVGDVFTPKEIQEIKMGLIKAQNRKGSN